MRGPRLPRGGGAAGRAERGRAERGPAERRRGAAGPPWRSGPEQRRGHGPRSALHGAAWRRRTEGAGTEAAAAMLGAGASRVG